MAKQKTEIVDIFNGKFITAWRDEDTYYFSTPFSTLNFSEEMWEDFKKDLDKFSEL